MARCGYCDSFIIFGGVKEEGVRFCSKNCLENGQAVLLSQKIPEDFVIEQMLALHSGPCLRCGMDNGPVDVHVAYKIWSLLYVSSWKSVPKISCRKCGVKSQVFGLVSSLILGWWNFPYGIFMTPVQIVRNIAGIARKHPSDMPSEQMEHAVRRHLAQDILAEQGQTHLPKS